MSTTTRRTARAPKTAAQFSIAAAKLIEQLRSEARAQLLTELSAKDAIIVLHGFDPETKKVRSNGYDIIITDAKGNSASVFRRHVEPESWRGAPHMQGHWNPAFWYGDQTFVDACGTNWSRSLGTMVCDDFGTLVQVAA